MGNRRESKEVGMLNKLQKTRERKIGVVWQLADTPPKHLEKRKKKKNRRG